jgi:glycosyltransferase involved in cell wall biosynthesis
MMTFIIYPSDFGPGHRVLLRIFDNPIESQPAEIAQLVFAQTLRAIRMIKVSIVTVCFNSAETIGDTIRSVIMQKYLNIEYIVIDGGSSDGTQQIVKSYGDDITTFISEPDSGIYDAMNKGIRLCTGDLIGILNSDDFYETDQTIRNLVNNTDMSTDIVFGDVVVVDRHDTSKYVRYINAVNFRSWMLKFGWMPPHPATFVRSSVYKTFGLYKLDYQIAADYEFFIRVLLVGGVCYKYEPNIVVTMRHGGASTKGLVSTSLITKEILRSCKEKGVKTNIFFVWSRLPLKVIKKLKFLYITWSG